MHFSELPLSEPVFTSSIKIELAQALGTILGNSQDDIFYMLPITGLSFSGRLLSREKIQNGVCVNDMFRDGTDINVVTLADQLMRFTKPDAMPPARYNGTGDRKGWEIRKTIIGKQNVAIAYAAWA